MYSGRLTYRAVSVCYTNKQSLTGSIKKTEVDGKEFRYARQTIKEQRMILGNENVKTGTVIIICRMSPITEGMTHFRIISGEGRGADVYSIDEAAKHELYRIDSRIPNYEDRTYEITAIKVVE